MSMKKKKSTQMKMGEAPAAPSPMQKALKKHVSAPKNPPQPVPAGIGKSFSLLLDRTKAYFRPAEKVNA